MSETKSEGTSVPRSVADTRADDALAEVADDFLRRHRLGEHPSTDEYARKHPELADRIRELFPAMLAMEHPSLGPPELGISHEASPPAEHIGATVGRYKLLERIGEGGFGVVYMAEQHHPVRRKVALKVVKPGMDSRQVLARFEAERQALAIMDHPNIAKVFDGGMTNAGRPYFVMELVKGAPITAYCDRNQLPPRQRLELFAQVCNAVQHAHQKGIIHRDLKPTNVLVAVHDTTPVVKVIDFGVAKALGQELTERTLFTGFAQLVGTPLYMSPEQAGESSLDIDTRSDIYSLGVLLYELLTGTTPFDKERFRKAAQEEIRRIIREEEPPRPSTRLSQSKESLASVSAQRQTEPAKLTKLVRGELDWIVMKALEKDRSRRYETANGLAMDVQRYLRDEPVTACPPSSAYRLRKFTRRNRVPLGIAVGFLSLLIAGVVTSTYQALRIRAEQKNTMAQKVEADGQRRIAEQERDRAERELARAVAAEQKALAEAAKSEQVAAFMTDMLRGVGPSVALGRDTTMLREILDKTTKRLDQLKGQPAVEADLRTVLGGVYVGLGEDERAEAMYRAALTLRRGLFGNKHADVARALVALSDPLSRQRRFAEAETLLTEGLAMKRELLGKDHWDVGWALFYLGLMENRRGRSAEAETHLREALAILREHPNADIKGTLGQLALSLTRQRKYAEAEPIARECVELQRKQAPSGSPGLATALYNLGGLYRDQGRPAEAEPLHREALEIRRKLLPPGHVDTLVGMSALAWVLIDRDRTDEAIPLIDEFVLRANATGKTGLQGIPLLINRRLRHFQKVQDVAGCRKSAEMWEGLNRSDAAFYYDAACHRAVAAAVIAATDRSPDAAKVASAEADRAMAWLAKSFAVGQTQSARARHDSDFEALRGRKDFQELLATGEANALADLTRAIEKKSKDATAYVARGVFLGQAGRLPEALTDFDKATELDPKNLTAWYGAATVSLSVGDMERYRRVCAQLLERADKRGDVQAADSGAKAAGLAPASVSDFALVERLAERCVTGTEEHRFRRWFVLTKGLTEYRAGRHAQAVEWLGRFAPRADGAHWDATGFAALAMANHRLGKAAAARASLDAARALVTKKRADPMGNDAWRDWLHAEILYREAEQVIGAAATTRVSSAPAVPAPSTHPDVRSGHE